VLVLIVLCKLLGGAISAFPLLLLLLLLITLCFLRCLCYGGGAVV
jgi:hypothetical protein